MKRLRANGSTMHYNEKISLCYQENMTPPRFFRVAYLLALPTNSSILWHSSAKFKGVLATRRKRSPNGTHADKKVAAKKTVK
jgi:hypothetical protein